MLRVTHYMNLNFNLYPYLIKLQRKILLKWISNLEKTNFRTLLNSYQLAVHKFYQAGSHIRNMTSGQQILLRFYSLCGVRASIFFILSQ